MTAITWLKNTDEGNKILSKAENNKNITVYIMGTHSFRKGSLGSTVVMHSIDTRFRNKKNGKKILGKQQLRGPKDLELFLGLNVTADVQQKRDLYLVAIDVKNFGNISVANTIGHELEAHVNINQKIKDRVKPNNRIDVNINGKSKEVDDLDWEHMSFGSEAVEEKSGKVIIIEKGKSADRLQEQLIRLWVKKVTPQITF